MSNVLIDDYFDMVKKVHDYFGYTEGWILHPLYDSRSHYWRCGAGFVLYAETEDELQKQEGNYFKVVFCGESHKDRMYEVDDCTMFVVSSQDGNSFLQIFDNSKRREKTYC